MYKVGDYVVYKREVCEVISIKEKEFMNMDYYVLVPISDNTLKIDVPVNNKMGYLRSLITKKEVEDIIKTIPNIKPIISTDRLIENEYRNLLNTNKHEDLIKIIKTTYLRNKERLDNNKKIGGKDDEYFKQAEKYLYSEFSIFVKVKLQLFFYYPSFKCIFIYLFTFCTSILQENIKILQILIN